MSHQYTKKRAHDAKRFAHWHQQTDDYFARHKLTRAQVMEAQAGLQGWIVLPGDPAYDKDRVIFNPLFNDIAYPSVIVYCVVESDVAIALQMAQDKSFMVRSGGHCTAGFSTGSGVLIDVSNLKSISVDPDGMTATVGCGTPFGSLNQALAPYNLNVPGGECDDVCIGGYMQGGGYGFTSVTWGMNCDNVLSMRVMLADGGIVVATPSQNWDLWWAMRGGTGGTFGVLLSVTYQLYALGGDVFGWAIIFPMQTDTDFQNATNAMLCLQSNYMRFAPSPLLNIQVSLCYQPSMYPGVTTGPVKPGPGLPPSNMQPYLMLRGLYVGDQTNGQAAIQQLCNLPGAVTQWTKMDSFINLNQDLLNQPYGMPCFPPGTPMPFEDKASRYVAQDLSADFWMGLLRYYVTTPNQYAYFYMEFYGGAINAYPTENSAFIHRNTAFNSVMDVFWSSPEEQGPAQAFLDGWIDMMEPWYDGHAYQNYPRLNDPNFAYKYWGDAQAGLYAVKCKYDPSLRFEFAQCVGPIMPPGHGIGPVIIFPPAFQAALNQPIVYAAPPDAVRKSVKRHHHSHHAHHKH